jgi:hypothetical protein
MRTRESFKQHVCLSGVGGGGGGARICEGVINYCLQNDFRIRILGTFYDNVLGLQGFGAGIRALQLCFGILTSTFQNVYWKRMTLTFWSLSVMTYSA